MVFVFELEDEGRSLDRNGLPDTLSPVQRAWLLKSMQDGLTAIPSETSISAHNDSSGETDDTLGQETHADVTDEGLGGVEDGDEIVGLNMNSFSACLCCYPIVSQLAAELDLNSIDNLARTCKQFRATLLLFRDQLITRTLRCSNDEVDEENQNPIVSEIADIPRSLGERWIKGKVGKCARDLVGECRKCGKIVCRNCIAKPPPDPHLPRRLRRLCPTCLKIPLISHMDHRSPSPILLSPQQRSSAGLISRTPTPSSTSSSWSFPPPKESIAFSAKAFLRSPCICTHKVYLCGPCGSSLSANDTLYARGITWRRQYGGFLSGVSEGHKGLPCGKEDKCLAARCVEREIEVDAAEYYASSGSEPDHEQHHSTTSASSLSGIDENAASGRSWTDGGFLAQEVEGIGGGVKMKKRQLVKVGAEVDEDEDSGSEAPLPAAGSSGIGAAAASAKYLKKEKSGERRSFCAWCERIVPSVDDGWDGSI